MYNITKQPKWVQDEVAGLERRISDLLRQVDELMTDEAVAWPGDLEWKRPIGVENRIESIHDRRIVTSPQGTHVYFKTGGRRQYLEVYQLGHDQSYIEIRSSNGQLVVEPAVSNVIRVSIKREDC